ncbi:two component system sensor histidine kinase, hybrid [Desulfosarcina variabilis str. Montpellier]|uniref:ATP-binding protein n=1 Tax=Desulfosarcina variabilis TaxID=2300 RepID=UPI003AFAFA99
MAPDKQMSPEAIRRKAESIAQNRPLVLPADQAEQRKAIIHELHVHQIELEIQNEELRSIQSDVENARNKYSDLFNNAPVGYLILDRSGIIREANRTFAFKAEVELDQLTGKPFADHLTDTARHNFHSQFKSFFNRPDNKRIDVQLKASNGAYLAVFGSREAGLPHATGKDGSEHERIRIVCIDITAQRLAEKALAKAYESLSIRHEIADIILKTADEDMFCEVLDRLRVHFKSRYGFFGYIDDMENLVCPTMTWDIFPQCQIENKSIVFPKSCWGGLWGESLTSKKTIRRNHGLDLPHGHIQLSNALVVPLVNQGTLVGQIAVAEKAGGYTPNDEQLLDSIARWIAPVLAARLERDRYAKQRIKAENDLRQAQRMESIGVLAGGIAHDFNNILSPIIGYTDMLIEETRDTSVTHRQLKEVSKAAHRAKDLVGQLLAFSRKQMLAFKSLDINQCIENISTMINRLIREDISVVYHLDPSVEAIKADPSQIDQILLNLAVNAQDAMADGGTLTIATAGRRIDNAMEKEQSRIPPGAYVELSVEDTGSGIAEDVLPFIFEPFFTTKQRGQGTGMGLATCYGIVRQHEGYIWAESRLAMGTRFFVWLPVASQTEIVKVDHRPEANALPVAHGETILVVEDEPAVRKMAVIILQRLGYQVVDVDSPEACLALVQAGETVFDLLLSDVIMPGCNGKELYLQLKTHMPDLKVIFMSGYTDNIISDKGIFKENVHFIGKPFTLGALSLKVRDVLDGEP